MILLQPSLIANLWNDGVDDFYLNLGDHQVKLLLHVLLLSFLIFHLLLQVEYCYHYDFDYDYDYAVAPLSTDANVNVVGPRFQQSVRIDDVERQLTGFMKHTHLTLFIHLRPSTTI